MTAAGARPRNGISVDLEDWYALVARRIEGREVEPSERVVTATTVLLELLDRCSTRATFFVLGTVAARFPDLIRAVRDRGHEIASHGYGHRRLDRIDAAAFGEDLRRATGAIEAACGVRPVGHRAPEFTVLKRTLWAFDVLAAEGFRYDSSVFPIAHRRYGIADAPRAPYLVSTPSGTITELPLATLELFGRRIPTAGGGYLRFFPYASIESSVRQANAHGDPAVLYVHPYEFDPEPLAFETRTLGARIFVAAQNAFRHRAAPRLERLLRSFRFEPLGAMTVP